MSNIKASAVVYETAVLEDNVQIGYNAVILSGIEAGKITVIKNGATIGSNSTIYEGITVGARAVVMPGSVVNQSVPPLAIVEGNPAKITGYVETSTKYCKDQRYSQETLPAIVSTSVSGVCIHNLRNIPDMRGCLTAGEFGKDIPFHSTRYFLVYDVPTAETRGEHAHFKCKQFLIAIKGAIHVVADDGKMREEFVLDRPSLGLYLPPMTWGIQYRYSSDAVLLVFASDPYDSSDYIRSYEDFVKLKQQEVRN